LGWFPTAVENGGDDCEPQLSRCTGVCGLARVLSFGEDPIEISTEAGRDFGCHIEHLQDGLLACGAVGADVAQVVLVAGRH
jgi:hypothetical protein